MIQRVQTIYLFMAVLLSILLFFMPLASITIPGPGSAQPVDNTTGDAADVLTDMDLVYELDVFTIDRKFGPLTSTLQNAYWLAGINVFVMILSLIVIFLYRNRALQAQLVRLCFFMVLLFIVFAFYYSREMQELARAGSVSYKLADLFPILQLLFFHLALRGINKDEALVKSADRIR